MKRAVLLVTPSLLIDLFKVGPARAFEVTDFGLPEDTEFVDVRYINSQGVIALEIESEAFNEVPAKGAPPVLPSPICRRVDEDELLARVDALKQAEKTETDHV